MNLDQPRSSGAHKILTELLCPARARSRNSLAATRPRFDFIYTKNFQGGDATENRDFQREKQRLQGTNFFSDLILSKERILEQGRGLF